jgi:hypothetical protein
MIHTYIHTYIPESAEGLTHSAKDMAGYKVKLCAGIVKYESAAKVTQERSLQAFAGVKAVMLTLTNSTRDTLPTSVVRLVSHVYASAGRGCVCVYVCVCMCVCMRVCVNIYIYIYIYICC